MLSLHLGTAIHKPSSSLLVNRDLFIGHHLCHHRIQQLLGCFQSILRGKEASHVLINSSLCPPGCMFLHKPFLLYTVLFWALHSLVACSSITQDVMHILGIRVILCSSVIESVSIHNGKLVTFLNGIYFTTASRNVLVQKSRWSLLKGIHRLLP